MEEHKSINFIEEIVEQDLKDGKYKSIITRFPPEPNGFLHIGHAKSICFNFGLAIKYNGKCNLRFDDTNPETEKTDYVNSIKTDIQWLGFNWDAEYYASDYFDQLYNFAIKLIEKDLAYVDDSTSEEIANLKGTPTSVGSDSPFRNRAIAENLELFKDMKAGKYPDGSKVLRAKIDMKHHNMLMRDPIIYRIKHAHHHRTENKWCIYPMYDFAHGQSDSIEQITHSICTLEFVPHRELYDWFIQQLDIFPSKQYEFARGNMSYAITSKRNLLKLVNEKVVSGWDDPRMPTISGLRRRGFTPQSIRLFWEKVGIQKRENLIDVGLLEFCVREELNKISLRRMAVLDPIKLVITNYPADKTENLSAENNPEDENGGHRSLAFGKELWIERDDFMENPSPKYFRLGVGLSVRLKHAYIITCTHFDKDENGNITAVYCTYNPDTKSGQDQTGIKVKGTIHWVDVKTANTAEVHLYDRLFTVENPGMEEGDILEYINNDSLKIIKNAMIEPSLSEARKEDYFQFVRMGYFCLDTESSADKIKFNRTVTLKDNWAKKK
ncbi:MAG: glutamine--tRNA ligase/YqeY domain fusion protein [Bacteroidetes bacterium]|jgi:glutaminyl-tRNA synthetase|nr:glutamine--tRNA ligase/YqeY domain fusion protein [Bacteroidota bacterium]MBK9352573.1 glutamine--tRNA ligase/YqeY domain fusion protein [Bacteroidota bacterium]MBL0080251.1 glutamine--tRNA ligase/YqeY domain fusion protein [Bacteroidota bacterium]